MSGMISSHGYEAAMGTAVCALALYEHSDIGRQWYDLILNYLMGVTCGHGFDEAATAAMSAFRFEPTTKDGVPIPSKVLYVYRFLLKEAEPPEDEPPPEPLPSHLKGSIKDMDDGPLDFWQVARRLAGSGLIEPLATVGVVGQVTRTSVVYDAETTHGGSGGPVLILDGRVLAINAAVVPEFGGSNLGVPAAEALRLLRQPVPHPN